jgi:hypothetical protein
MSKSFKSLKHSARRKSQAAIYEREDRALSPDLARELRREQEEREVEEEQEEVPQIVWWCVLMAAIGLFFCMPALFSSCEETILLGKAHDCTATERWLNLRWACGWACVHLTVLLIGVVPYALDLHVDDKATFILLVPYLVFVLGSNILTAVSTPWDESGETMPLYLICWPAGGLLSFAYIMYNHKEWTGLRELLEGDPLISLH